MAGAGRQRLGAVLASGVVLLPPRLHVEVILVSPTTWTQSRYSRPSPCRWRRTAPYRWHTHPGDAPDRRRRHRGTACRRASAAPRGRGPGRRHLARHRARLRRSPSAAAVSSLGGRQGAVRAAGPASSAQALRASGIVLMKYRRDDGRQPDDHRSQGQARRRGSRRRRPADGNWLAQLKAAPVEGKANAELIAPVARHFRRRQGVGVDQGRRVGAAQAGEDRPGLRHTASP